MPTARNCSKRRATPSTIRCARTSSHSGRRIYEVEKAGHATIEQSSTSGIARALHFARTGDWDKARTAFSDQNAVRKDITKALAEHKAALVAAQTKEIRSRQKDATEALLDVRKEQYAQLLQHQREERGALQAGVTLEQLNFAGPPLTAAANANLDRAIEAAAPMANSPQTKATPDAQHATEPIAENHAHPEPAPRRDVAPAVIENEPQSQNRR